jgi:hypothetical protein
MSNIFYAVVEGGSRMQFIQLIWNGIGGLGAGTVLLKALFILVFGAVFWMVCELLKYLFELFSKLAVDALRYLAIIARGWPKEEQKGEEKKYVTR